MLEWGDLLSSNAHSRAVQRVKIWASAVTREWSKSATSPLSSLWFARLAWREVVSFFAQNGKGDFGSVNDVQRNATCLVHLPFPRLKRCVDTSLIYESSSNALFTLTLEIAQTFSKNLLSFHRLEVSIVINWFSFEMLKIYWKKWIFGLG